MSYYEEARDGARDARAREQQALNHGIELLQKAQAGDPGSAECTHAMLYIRKLWTFFLQDLSNPGNGLPEKLRADLISIGLWIIKEADVVRQSNSGDIGSLIAVNTAMRDALR